MCELNYARKCHYFSAPYFEDKSWNDGNNLQSKKKKKKRKERSQYHFSVQSCDTTWQLKNKWNPQVHLQVQEGEVLTQRKIKHIFRVI